MSHIKALTFRHGRVTLCGETVRFSGPCARCEVQRDILLEMDLLRFRPGTRMWELQQYAFPFAPITGPLFIKYRRQTAQELFLTDVLVRRAVWPPLTLGQIRDRSRRSLGA